MVSRRLFLQSSAAVAITAASPVHRAWATNAPGITDAEIKIGQSFPYSGPASGYGAIARAEAAYFKMINEKGGINGRKLNLISLDDGYSAPKTVELTRRLIEENRVAFIFQTFGGFTNLAIRPYLNENKVPQLFGAAGADQLDDPQHFPWTVGFNPATSTEGRIYAKHILATSPMRRSASSTRTINWARPSSRAYATRLATRMPECSSRKFLTRSRSPRSIPRLSRCRAPGSMPSLSRLPVRPPRRRSAKSMTSAGRRTAIYFSARLRSPER